MKRVKLFEQFINKNLKNVDTEFVGEARDPKSIQKEYADLKKLSVKNLRDMWSRSYKVGNPKELDKEGLISDILRSKHGDKYVDAAFEAVSLNELKKSLVDYSDSRNKILVGLKTNLLRDMKERYDHKEDGDTIYFFDSDGKHFGTLFDMGTRYQELRHNGKLNDKGWLKEQLTIVESKKSDALAWSIDKAMIEIDDSMSYTDFALAVGKILKDEYGKHTFKGFMEVLHKNLGI